jgi:SAM-dependent methyltransferase
VDDWLTTVAAFRAGRPSLLPHEIDELGPLDGCRVLHLQCHLGLDTLDLARLHPTVMVTGLDFFAPAIEAATALAKELRLAQRARFVLADVYHAPEVLGEARFDVVYTGKGALLWLPDLDRWAAIVKELLAPGGFLYLNELHPVGEVLAATEPLPVRDYFATTPSVSDTGTPDNARYEWQHPLSRVLTALLGAGLRLELFHEWDFALDGVHRWLVPGIDGRLRWPPGMGTLPLLYSLKAVRPN